jgi:hypothetical protein
MDAVRVCSSETLVLTLQTTRLENPEHHDMNLTAVKSSNLNVAIFPLPAWN